MKPVEIKCNLILDSCCDLPHDVVDREGVYLVKFPYFDDDGEHLDDLYQSITAHDFYEGMRNGGEPHTVLKYLCLRFRRHTNGRLTVVNRPSI